MTLEKLMESARTVGISTKQVLKVKHFHDFVEQTLQEENVHYDRIVNFFCGNGLATWYWLMTHDNLHTESADIRKTQRYKEVKAQVINFSPNIDERDVFNQLDLTQPEPYQMINPHDLLIAIHACGNLSDEFIRNCTKQKLLFAVVPCCHDRDSFVLSPNKYPSGELYQEQRFDVYQDLIRAQYAKEQGYKIFWGDIPENITPKNRIMIGIPN